jgi:flavin reductase
VIDRPSLFRLGMRRLAAGVSVVTTLEDGVPRGFVATAVTSVCAEPTPCLLVCVNRSVSSHDALHRSGILCVNVLAEGDATLAARFASSNDRERRFEGCAWESLMTGAPALEGALASFDCEIKHEMPVHSHTVFIAEVKAVRLSENELAPLIYVDGRYERLGAAAGYGAAGGDAGASAACR